MQLGAGGRGGEASAAPRRVPSAPGALARPSPSPPPFARRSLHPSRSPSASSAPPPRARERGAGRTPCPFAASPRPRASNPPRDSPCSRSPYHHALRRPNRARRRRLGGRRELQARGRTLGRRRRRRRMLSHVFDAGLWRHALRVRDCAAKGAVARPDGRDRLGAESASGRRIVTKRRAGDCRGARVAGRAADGGGRPGASSRPGFAPLTAAIVAIPRSDVMTFDFGDPVGYDDASWTASPASSSGVVASASAAPSIHAGDAPRWYATARCGAIGAAAKTLAAPARCAASRGSGVAGRRGSRAAGRGRGRGHGRGLHAALRPPPLFLVPLPLPRLRDSRAVAHLRRSASCASCARAHGRRTPNALARALRAQPAGRWRFRVGRPRGRGGARRFRAAGGGRSRAAFCRDPAASAARSAHAASLTVITQRVPSLCAG